MKLAAIAVALMISTCLSIVACGQKTITGRIVDVETKKPVANVNVVIKGTTNGTITNYLGFFQLDVRKKDSLLVFSHVAYETTQFAIPKEDKLLFQLTPSTTVLTTLDISNFREDMKYEIGEDPAVDRLAILEMPARFKGGEEGIFNYLGENLKVPDSSARGTVTLTFTVDKNGRTGKITAEGDTLKGIGVQLTSLIANMPSWTPAIQRGTPVDQRFKVNVKYGNIVFLVVETPASFPGGMESFYKYIMNNLKYPAEARNKRIQGKVFVEFVITRTGKIDPQSVRTIKGLGYGLDEEAERVIKGCPDWIPGSHRGERVAQTMVMPLAFKLQ